jgi:hypothetical protein
VALRLVAVVRAAFDMRVAWSEHVHQHGFEHEEGCPEDDTCECPLVVAVNRSDAEYRAALAALEGAK